MVCLTCHSNFLGTPQSPLHSNFTTHTNLFFKLCLTNALKSNRWRWVTGGEGDAPRGWRFHVAGREGLDKYGAGAVAWHIQLAVCRGGCVSRCKQMAVLYTHLLERGGHSYWVYQCPMYNTTALRRSTVTKVIPTNDAHKYLLIGSWVGAYCSDRKPEPRHHTKCDIWRLHSPTINETLRGNNYHSQ